MKTIMIIADGLAGRPTDLDGRTCLQVADTPEIDGLVAKKGLAGLLDPIRPGVRPGSDTAHLSLFGYDPYQYYTGRGVFEAAGIGMEVTANSVCFRTNFATVDSDGKILDRRAGRISEGQDELEEALSGLESEKYPDVKVRFKRSTEHRGALCLTGPKLGGEVTPTDPHETGVVIPDSQGANEESQKTADILDEVTRKSQEILENHPVNDKRIGEGKPPANSIICRGAAKAPSIPSVGEKFGVSASVVAAGALYIGAAKLVGMEYKQAEGATGTVESNIKNKVKLALEELDQGKDMVFVHFKGTDNASHDHDARQKVKFIEKIDRTFGWLKDRIDWNQTHLSFAGDHTTPIQLGEHVGDPVPAMIAGPNVRVDRVQSFDEISVNDGGLGRVSGNLLPITLAYSNQLKMFGA